MKAVVIHEAGGPDILKVEDRPVPRVKPVWILVLVWTFGLNRSELFTRLGHSPNVTLSRILGIEAVSEIAGSSDTSFANGDTVASAMGGMGRSFDGGYAEYALVPTSQVQKVNTSLGRAQFGAPPEMVQTAWGSTLSRIPVRRRGWQCDRCQSWRIFVRLDRDQCPLCGNLFR